MIDIGSMNSLPGRGIIMLSGVSDLSAIVIRPLVSNWNSFWKVVYSALWSHAGISSLDFSRLALIVHVDILCPTGVLKTMCPAGFLFSPVLCSSYRSLVVSVFVHSHYPSRLPSWIIWLYRLKCHNGRAGVDCTRKGRYVKNCFKVRIIIVFNFINSNT